MTAEVAAAPHRQVLVVEPWYGGSHRAWADGIDRHSRHRVHLVTHPPRAWRWRLRGGALTLAAEVAAVVAGQGRPDVVLVGDLVDVAALRGLAGRALAGVPVVLYLHENQITEAVGPGTRGDRGAAWATWTSLVAADVVVANSGFHREALLAALPGFLDDVPDHPHHRWLPVVADRMEVLPVPVPLGGLLGAPRPDPDGGPPLVLFNQRRDHDKRPEALTRVLVALADAGVAFRVALTGHTVRTDLRDLDADLGALGDRVVHVGPLDRAGYEALLLRSDVVVATAAHEFFGVAPVEAMAAGCVPLLPDRLAYPELVPTRWHGAVLYRGRLFDRLRAVLEDLPAARAAVAGLRESMARFDAPTVVPAYDDLLERVAADPPGPAAGAVR